MQLAIYKPLSSSRKIKEKATRKKPDNGTEGRASGSGIVDKGMPAMPPRNGQKPAENNKTPPAETFRRRGR